MSGFFLDKGDLAHARSAPEPAKGTAETTNDKKGY